ncbi:MAG: primosomal protein N' [Gammaproteobacteria bacterium]|jgi:primosomal protein N' (replication factor Y)|nr:primosomal protein N' [Gammaproteobacteria bacterium]MBT6879087.1 primosomal protein N' [Gammaproteobacteria bacterium]MBT7478513.1 primosomal protein N' [Gammaproteobacteria bacterium]HIJ24382.1 primosomal protein N' [Gammaproteobacteria bacterium]
MILQIALLTVPLRKTFDYLPLPESNPVYLQPGIRIRVPFGRQQRIGILIAVSDESLYSPDKLKPILEILDRKPLLSEPLHQLLLHSAHYYHHPIGEVYEAALPVLLRQGSAATPTQTVLYAATDEGAAYDATLLKRAPRQQQLLELLQNSTEGVNSETLQQITPHWKAPLQKLVEKGWASAQQKTLVESAVEATAAERPHPLNPEQQHATDRIQQQLQGQSPRTPLLLEGVTGSGKTEVYLQAIQQVVDGGKQALILVPEISLTPQTVQRFRARFRIPIALLHSRRSRRERLNDWLAAGDGRAKIIIGTRSAIFTPLQNPGILIIDEEHDGSFKQQEGFRYSARNLAVLRAQQEQIPVILGSATPSFESLHNTTLGKYQKLTLQQRAGGAVPPDISLIDMRSRKMAHLLSPPLLEKIQHHLEQQSQILLFLNRRGYAPTLFCKSCGWIASCPRCEVRYTYHQHRNRMVCHHCSGERPHPGSCPECGSDSIKNIGAGTERIEEALQQQFPNHSITRIDGDTTRKKGAMDEKLEQIHAGDHQLLLGTQMLAKGHHFPNVTLVAILDADGGLFGSDFRATEQMGQLITQVAGRAGRGSRRGEMVIQTHNPDHPLLRTLLQQGYPAFAAQALSERKLATLPPYSYLTLIRAEASSAKMAQQFLTEVRNLAQQYMTHAVEILGPVPSPMEKRAGRYRAQLLLQSTRRTPLHQLLTPLVPSMETLKSSRKVRWSVDVDPMEML